MPEFFKYNSVVSVWLFAITSLFLMNRISNFSLAKQTISKSILFLNSPVDIVIFRLNFIVKALLDLGFYLFVLSFLKVPPFSLLSFLMMASALLFGSLAYFTESKNRLAHRMVVYLSGMAWLLASLLLAYRIGNHFLLGLTYGAAFLVLFSSFGFLFAKKMNAFVQIFCMTIMYIWLVYFVFEYL